MEDLKIRNQKIINAVIERAEKKCPESLALIGIYGSFTAGDFYEKSDLDLLILINDSRGRQLGDAFIQDDLEVGHDIYCTAWEELREAAMYNEPNIAKLMDSQIVYCSNEKYLTELETLRRKATEILQKPFSAEDYAKAENMLKEAEHFYMSAMTAEKLSDIRTQAGYALYFIENAAAMLNKKYFRYGTKRTYEELEAMERRPENLCKMIENVLSANSAKQVKDSLNVLIRDTVRVFQSVKKEIPVCKKEAACVIGGTYEEMYSNWRNKMYLASRRQDRHLAFMCITDMNAMLADISSETEIKSYSLFDCYDPGDLQKTAQTFDDFLKETSYEKSIEKSKN